MNSVVVAAPTWKQFQQWDDDLPDGVFVTQRRLQSPRVPVHAKRFGGAMSSLINARWPADGLCSTIAPVLCFVIAGAVALPLGDYVVHCLPGHAVLMPAGTPRPDGTLSCLDASRAGNNYCSMLSFMPWAEGVECWINHSDNREHSTYRNPGEHGHVLHAQANFYLEALAEAAIERSPEYRLHCQGLLLALSAVLAHGIRSQQLFNPGLLTEPSLDATAPVREQNPIKRAQTYINAHLQTPLSIDKMADYVYMSRAQFTRQFKQVTGRTFLEYVTWCRLEKAKVLLQNTDWTLRKIAFSVGVSPDRLRNIFLKYEHQTPATFRRDHLAQQ